MAAPAAGKVAKVAWAHRDRVGDAILAALLTLLALLMVVVMIALLAVTAAQWAFDSYFGGGDAVGRLTGPDAVMIEKYEPIYRAAAAEFGVNFYLLASVHKQESSFSTGSAQGIRSGINSYGCCAGPMQFNVTNGSPSTWDSYKSAYKRIADERPSDYPLKQSTHPSIYDDFDAIAAAAHKLSHDGATRDLYAEGTYRAVCAYIGSCSNVKNCGGPNDYCQVLPRAREWAKQGTAPERPPVHGPFVPDDVGKSSAFPLPKAGDKITSRFGETGPSHPNPHDGLDLSTAVGSSEGLPVYAFHAGKVSTVIPLNGAYGNFICIDHPGLAVASCYAHLRTGSMLVRPGQSVKAGERIASVGSTGHVTGPHLHFEIRGDSPDHESLTNVTLCPAQYLGLSYTEACALPSL